MSAASEGKLGELHNKIAEVLIDALEGQELPEVIDPDSGDVIQEATKMPVSAAHITAAIQFLKNNNITCAPSEDNALGELQRKMQERQRQRAERRNKPTNADLAGATEQVSWMQGHVGTA